jgi:hypothetical protein
VLLEGLVYASIMKSLQIQIDDDIDRELEQLAAEFNMSKASLVQQFVRERIRPLPLSDDPLFQMAGADDFEPAPIDDVVYR